MLMIHGSATNHHFGNKPLAALPGKRDGDETQNGDYHAVCMTTSVGMEPLGCRVDEDIRKAEALLRGSWLFLISSTPTQPHSFL